MNLSVPADGDAKDFQPRSFARSIGSSPALSMANTVKKGVQTRKVALLAADGVDGAALSAMQRALKAARAQSKIIAPRLGTLTTAQGQEVTVDWSFLTAGSVLFDAVFVPGGEKSATTLVAEPRAVEFVGEAYKHCKTIGATGEGAGLLEAAGIGAGKAQPGQKEARAGVVVGKGSDNGFTMDFIKAVAQHRHWSRERKE
jgi:catalase